MLACDQLLAMLLYMVACTWFEFPTYGLGHKPVSSWGSHGKVWDTFFFIFLLLVSKYMCFGDINSNSGDSRFRAFFSPGVKGFIWRLKCTHLHLYPWIWRMKPTQWSKFIIACFFQFSIREKYVEVLMHCMIQFH